METENQSNNNQWHDLDSLFLRDTKYKYEGFEPGQEIRDMFHNEAKVVVIGAGGLGCEILKDLALSGLKHIDVVDMDTIDVTNLNRQFLFRKEDVGKPKATVAAKFIMNRVKGCIVTPHFSNLNDLGLPFFKQFNVIIGGLDSVRARRDINKMVHSMVEFDDQQQPIPATQVVYVDGGTEGFMGQTRFIIPYKTSCYECTLDQVVETGNFQLCTIANNPRSPEHCVAYIKLVEWKEYFKEKPINTDSPEDIQWIYEKAKERADKFKIQGVTYNLTLGVVKNIIPAIASTNALISAATVTEVVKALSGCSKSLNVNYLFSGNTDIFTNTLNINPVKSCPVCSVRPIFKKVKLTDKLKDFKQFIMKEYEFENVNMIQYDGTLLTAPTSSLKAVYDVLLELSFQELIDQNKFNKTSRINIIGEKTVKVEKNSNQDAKDKQELESIIVKKELVYQVQFE